MKLILFSVSETTSLNNPYRFATKSSQEGPALAPPVADGFYVTDLSTHTTNSFLQLFTSFGNHNLSHELKEPPFHGAKSLGFCSSTNSTQMPDLDGLAKFQQNTKVRFLQEEKQRHFDSLSGSKSSKCMFSSRKAMCFRISVITASAGALDVGAHLSLPGTSSTSPPTSFKLGL